MSAAAWMVAIVVAIAGCRADPTAAVARAIPTPVDRTARTFLAALRNGNLAAAESLVVAPQRGSAAVRAAIGQMATTFGRAAPDSLRPLNVAAFFGGGASRVRGVLSGRLTSTGAADAARATYGLHGYR